MADNTSSVKLTRLLLDRLPLPTVADDADKESRGVMLAIGGSERIPGAMLLAGVASLRAGAGKLQIATVKRAAIALAMSLPEAMVVGLRAGTGGEISRDGNRRALRSLAAEANAVLVGPGVMDDQLLFALMKQMIPRIRSDATLVLDGAAITALRVDDDLLRPLEGRAVLTPHCGEMASLFDIPREEVQANALDIARECAARFNCAVVLKGIETFIVAGNETPLCYRDGKPGLATSGSGDVLAGVIAGLCARGANARTAAAWGVWAHGSAGNKLSRSIGRIGFLASELLAEIPPLVNN